MMNWVRMNRIFAPDGRTLVLAMDHALSMGCVEGLEKPRGLLEAAAAERADAVLTTVGTLKVYQGSLGRTGLIVRADWGGSYLQEKPADPELVVRVEEALALGADALAVMVYPGASGDLERKSFQNLCSLVREAASWRVPVMAEVIPRGCFDAGRPSPDELASGVRMAAEAGADLVKTFYTGEKESFGRLVETAGVPVVVLGGPKVSGEVALLAMVGDALEAGAAGVAFGRNVWQHPRPALMLAALRKVIHEGKGAEEAFREALEEQARRSGGSCSGGGSAEAAEERGDA